MVLFSHPSFSQDKLLYGVQPFLPAVSLEKIYGPLITALRKDLQLDIQFRTRSSLESYQAAINAETFDIILVSPINYNAIKETTAYIPIIQRDSQMKGVIYSIDKDIKHLDHLRGKVIGFPPKKSALSILTLNFLLKAGFTVDEFNAQFFNEHLSCKQALVIGQVDACVSSPNFVDDRMLIYNKDYYQVWESPSIPSSVIMIHHRMSKHKSQLQQWFLSLNSTKEGQKILEGTFLGELAPFNEMDYLALDSLMTQ